MAPGRRHTESASNDFDECRFHDLDAQTSYHGFFSKRRLYLERDVTLSELQFTCVPRVFESRGWISLTSGFPAPPTNLVHEFYSNIHDIKEDGSFSVMVRNISFEVTPTLVSAVLGIPRVLESPYPYTAETAPSQTDMLTLFCGEHTIWPNGISKVKSASFIPEYQWLNRIMCTNLFPIAHLHTLNVPRAQLLYALITDVPIDICRHICQVIIDAFESNSSRTVLPLPCIITQLIEAQKVSIYAQDVREKPLSAFGSRTLHLSSSHMKRARDSDFDSDDDLDQEIDEIANAVPAESRPSTSGAQAAHAMPLAKCARHSVSDSDEDLNREIDVIADVVAAESKPSPPAAQAAMSKSLSVTGSNTLQLSSSHVKLLNHIAHDSKDDLDQDIDGIADAVAAESRPSTSSAAQPTLSNMMNLLQQILPRLNHIEQDIREINKCLARAH
ncbi:hypothetical protein ACB092_11G037000 [Castanea dentata]